MGKHLAGWLLMIAGAILRINDGADLGAAFIGAGAVLLTQHHASVYGPTREKEA